jgi:PhnB protein
LPFDGRCEAAFRVYQQQLGGKLGPVFRWRDQEGSSEVPTGWESKIYHASIRIGDLVLTGSDLPPDRYHRPDGFQVLLETTDKAETERIFAALADGGAVQMPLQPTSWAALFGAVIDQFGIPWSINCDAAEQPRLTETSEEPRLLEDIEQRIARAWLQHDRAAIERILAPEWTVTQADGSLLTRADVLGPFFEAVSFDSNVIDDVTVTLVEQTAVVRGRTAVAARVNGEHVGARVRFTDVFVKRNGEWRVIASHASSLA